MIGYDTYEEIKGMVFENIQCEHLSKYDGIDMRERLDEVADIVIEMPRVYIISFSHGWHENYCIN